MSYGYNILYDDYSLIEYAQPHPDLNFAIHPDSAAAQLGLTPEELAPILQEQQEFLNSLDSMGYKPEQQQHLRNELAQPPPILTRPTTTQLIPATQQLRLTQEEAEEVLQDQEEWMRDEEMREEKAPSPLEYTHNMAHNNDDEVGPFEHCNEPDDGAVHAEPDRNAIEPLIHELVVSDNAMGDWSEEMEMEPQGEYTLTNYSPSLSLTSPAPQNQPPPPITIYLPPPINYAPPPT
ncbi:hypothetical protein PILCRDRAFT_12368 [Piloderma croceum F 1598]|uniref:Uncharacterized protein n=1 Tax=Piloderma croceum (strain F 1598) TaxID=765440 RepID=A0A0C3FAT0_PILCF|nr:hypothetical protein PILCRDRAFT_12368 [Piloderma croceum F 1598]